MASYSDNAAQSRVDLGALVLRVTLGTMFVAHALLKVFVFTLPGTVQFFGSLGLPAAVAYLTIEGMMSALTSDDELGGDLGTVPDDMVGGYCNACFTGHYPFESVPVELGRKDVFDGVLADADHEAAGAAPVGLRP